MLDHQLVGLYRGSSYFRKEDIRKRYEKGFREHLAHFLVITP